MLTDPRSIARRYGPTCWKRVRDESERDYQDWLTERTTVADAVVAVKTLREVQTRIISYIDDEKCSCGEPLKSGDVLSFDHGRGILLKGYAQPQWVFLRCPECLNELNFRKLNGISFSDLAPDEEREC